MQERIVRRYSSCFVRQVVEELENGRFASVEQARRHYGIGGSRTIGKWLRRHGKNHLQAKVVIVQKPDEADQIGQLKRQVEQLQRALGQTQAQSLLNEQYLKMERLGEEVESFKKKHAGKPCNGPAPAER